MLVGETNEEQSQWQRGMPARPATASSMAALPYRCSPLSARCICLLWEEDEREEEREMESERTREKIVRNERVFCRVDVVWQRSPGV